VQRRKLLTALKVCGLVLFELSIISILYSARVEAVYAFLAFTAVFLLMLVLKHDVRAQVPRGYWLFIRIHEIVVVLASSLCLALYRGKALKLVSGPGSDLVYKLDPSLAIPCMLLSLLTLVLLVCALLRVRTYDGRRFNWLGCLLGIAFTTLVLGTIFGLTNWFNEPYVFSIACMATALICVIAGFITNIKPLRLYGLILVIISVLRLVTFDLANVESLMRVIAFIVGGLICFGISALYSYAVKRFDEKAKEDNPVLQGTDELR